MKILVIDDEPIEVRLMQAVLSSSGHSVLKAFGAEDALAAISLDRPELVIMDLNMPGIDGIALAKAIKSNPDTADICIVAVTAVPEQFSRQSALDAGCDAYMTKPLSISTLDKDLEEILPDQPAS